MVTRRTDPQGNSVGADDASDAQVGPRGRGRPKGTKGAIGAKGPSGKSKLMTKEGDQDITDQGEYDQEGDMAKDDIKTIVRHAQALSRVLGDDDNLPEWVQSKLAKIEGMMISIDEYMQNQSGDDGEEEPIAEKAVSKKQQRFMGMVHAAQKGEKPASKEVGKVAKTMKKKDAEDFASTKHKGLPEKKKKEVDENAKEESPGRLTTTMNSDGTSSTSSSTGRVSATLDNGKWEVKPGAPLTASSDTKQSGGGKGAKTGGMSFGQGIYDSMNRELEQMIAESMSVNMSDSTEGGKSLTITATDEDALKLAMMLRNAGLGGDAHGDGMHSHDEESCPTCGMEDCGCGDVQEAVDENAPDWPTNTEKADNNFGYAGGLNKAKASGMATIPVTDVSLDGEDMFSKPVHEDDELRRMQEMAGIKNEGNIDLGPRSPEIAAMSKDEVDSAIKASISPEVAAMDPDEVNAALGLDQDEQYEESIRRIREMAGIQEAKKDVEEEKTEEGNLFTGNLAKARAAGKKQADLDGDGDVEKVRESIFALNNQWKAYKG
jgi:tRNA threonylcarbamoyladenosine modification (KEOPS) complex  Pcc1 subunit